MTQPTVPRPATVLGSQAPPEPSGRVRGVVPVLEVPFCSDGQVDGKSFSRLLDHVLSTGVTAVTFPGFASEFHKLSEAERAKLVELLLVRVRGATGVAAVISVNSHSTLLSIAQALDALEKGAGVINLLPPYFLAPSREAVLEHLERVLDAVAPAPVVLQYAPGLTGTVLEAGAMAAMAREHPNLTFVKVETSPPGRMISALASQSPALPALVGYAGMLLPDALRRGAVGVQPGCSFTELYVEIWRRWSNGDESSAVELHRAALPFICYWMQHPELIVAAEKLISQRRGLIANAQCREPSWDLDSYEVAMVGDFLSEFGDILADRHG